MTMINITPHVLGEENMINEIRSWLYKNIGLPLYEYEKYPSDGQGWKIVTKTTDLANRWQASGTSTTWWVEFDDERLATLFLLSWA